MDGCQLSRRLSAMGAGRRRSLGWTARGQDVFQDMRNPTLLLNERVFCMRTGPAMLCIR